MTRSTSVVRFVLSVALCCACAGLSVAQHPPGATIRVRADSPGVKISPQLYGIFFEEINCAGDGGLYAEMVRNRSFEESDSPDFWSLVTTGPASGDMKIDAGFPPGEKNLHSLRLSIHSGVDGGTVGAANSGYWGMAVVKGSEYSVSMYARCSEDFQGPVKVSLERADGGMQYASRQMEGVTTGWKHYSLELAARATDPAARLVIAASHPGTLWLDVVSVFPKGTFKGRENGLRKDLAEMLSGIQPSFVRFPGGCWVEGESLRFSYRWKETTGGMPERKTQHNIWQYSSTNGLGYHEYLQMCEDLGAEPLFVINCGMSHTENVPLGEMKAWVQDALDAIEYANGPPESTWGSLRARNGHPGPFRLKYMEIGNENGGAAYEERYALFYDAIKAAYPQMHLIADVWGGTPASRPAEIIDEHYYSNPKFFITNATRYDTYDRKGPGVYVGEYAVTQGCGQGNLRAALGEAAFMTGMERNSDVVVMASYAPLFANANYKKWNPDLINFTSSRVYGTPSYYVQKMFSANRGDRVLPLRLEIAPGALEAPPLRHGRIGLGSWETQAEFKDIRVVRGAKVLFASDTTHGLRGWSPAGGDWNMVNGCLQQQAQGPDRRIYAGDTSWKDYTYSLKARKLGGEEGFLIMFHAADEDNWVWWNIGGWGNTRHALEQCEEGGKTALGKEVPGKIETGRWYDVRVELRGQSIQCFLDGALIHDVSYTQGVVRPLHAVASRVDSTGEIILKVVNVSKRNLLTGITLAGAPGISPRATAIVLTSPDPADENSLEHPLRVAPKTEYIQNASGHFTRSFPAHSVTVLRLKPEGTR
jgi:alpha-L-arabinofuranosidase